MAIERESSGAIVVRIPRKTDRPYDPIRASFCAANELMTGWNTDEGSLDEKLALYYQQAGGQVPKQSRRGFSALRRELSSSSVKDLSHFTQRPAKVDTFRCLIVESHVTVRNRPFLNLSGFQNGFTQKGRRHTIKALVCSKPNQVSVPFHEHVFPGPTQPRAPFIHLSVTRRHEPGNLFRVPWVGNIINPQTGVEVS